MANDPTPYPSIDDDDDNDGADWLTQIRQDINTAKRAGE